ncbi:Putative High mobility group box domain superfamily [Colletotrichum destructivum]|uniref:High mobility group box domain superfamily n=1 Tax=Colletotrichum destructivum TaxID=34406 RepID=A0AAX4J5B6_9PEZI|nr:Putative High mobility group box domain superfamily [Colletotrichum destructivum]
MAQQLEHIFAELGIPQYLGICLEQGFNTWEAIVATLESDLYAHCSIVVLKSETNDGYFRDALGVKSGYRRELQRRINNFRGLAPDTSLVSPSRTTACGPMLEAKRPGSTLLGLRTDLFLPNASVADTQRVTKDLKPDDNTPERSPSAFVLFSNSENRGQPPFIGNLNELYKTRAAKAKERYKPDLTEYQKTAEYRKYNKCPQEVK